MALHIKSDQFYRGPVASNGAIAGLSAQQIADRYIDRVRADGGQIESETDLRFTLSACENIGLTRLPLFEAYSARWGARTDSNGQNVLYGIAGGITSAKKTLDNPSRNDPNAQNVELVRDSGVSYITSGKASTGGSFVRAWFEAPVQLPRGPVAVLQTTRNDIGRSHISVGRQPALLGIWDSRGDFYNGGEDGRPQTRAGNSAFAYGSINSMWAIYDFENLSIFEMRSGYDSLELSARLDPLSRGWNIEWNSPHRPSSSQTDQSGLAANVDTFVIVGATSLQMTQLQDIMRQRYA